MPENFRQFQSASPRIDRAAPNLDPQAHKTPNADLTPSIAEGAKAFLMPQEPEAIRL
jgi:hypothetical protein